MSISAFQLTKLWLVAHTGLAKDALHIYVSLILFFGTMLILRWRVGDWRPWLVVLAAALAGELWDTTETMLGEHRVYWAANFKDIWNTLFWPSAILLMARFTPVFGRRNSR